MRPPGEIRIALLEAAATPGKVRDLCARAQVGFDVGRKTASRMLASGELTVLEGAGQSPATTGPGRPAAVVVAADALDCVQVLDTWAELGRLFRNRHPSVA